MLSTCVRHFGGFFGFLGRPPAPLPDRERDQARPDGDLGRQRASEGAVFGVGGLLPVASTVTVTTMARDTSHPNRHAAPFRTPRSRAANQEGGQRQRVERYRQADQGKVQHHGRPSLTRRKDLSLILSGRSPGFITLTGWFAAGEIGPI